MTKDNQQQELIIKEVAEANFPNKFGEFKIKGFENNLDDKCHVAVIKGDVKDKENVLVRLHSECLTGDVLGSMRCDCGEQLAAAMKRIEEEGQGVLVYLRQEGRGIGLANKLRAYELQDQGCNTIEANEKLGFPADMRDYRIGAEILKALGVKSVRLLTNNPLKLDGLDEYGIKVVERVPVKIKANPYDKDYLQIKKEQMGHML